MIFWDAAAGELVGGGDNKVMTSRRSKQGVASETETASGASMNGCAATNANCNYISGAIKYVKQQSVPLSNKWAGMPPTQRLLAIAIATPFVIVPMAWLIFSSPWILLFTAAVYSVLFGFRTFTAHASSAVREHFNVSNEVS